MAELGDVKVNETTQSDEPRIYRSSAYGYRPRTQPQTQQTPTNRQPKPQLPSELDNVNGNQNKKNVDVKNKQGRKNRIVKEPHERKEKQNEAEDADVSKVSVSEPIPLNTILNSMAENETIQHSPHMNRNSRPERNIKNKQFSHKQMSHDEETQKQEILNENDSGNMKAKKNRGKLKDFHEDVSDLMKTLSKRLEHGTYECMVCYEKIGKKSMVWSCKNCYAVFHLNCIQQWSQKSAKDSGWRCPGCQQVQSIIPNDYRCFCGKLTNPKWEPYFTPHSCGDVCGNKRIGSSCPHPCTILCHPGPCPPCKLFSPPSFCYCQKTSYRLKCGESDIGKSCENECGKTLNCKKHSCLKTCHPGQCQNCHHVYERICYCGKITKDIICGMEDVDLNGYFSCDNICGREFPCGKHKCQKKCHKGPCGDCPYSPNKVLTCPCGSSNLSELNVSRTSCTDPIPTCQNTCNKILDCISNRLHLDGDKLHFCLETCHLGDCSPCELPIKISCVCGHSSKSVTCASQTYESVKEFKCNKVCKIQRHCGRHLCGITCCPSRGSFSEMHECPNVCNRKLRCGKHFCTLPCHKGPCPGCLLASFDELSCQCGKTKMFPPVPCGAVLPPCHHPCSRQHSCDHPANHNCHNGETCPPCTILAPRQCSCLRKLVVMTPCHRKEGNCGRICGGKLKCGHTCARTCHTGHCDDSAFPCKAQCGQKRKCGHPCRANCHQDSPCPNITCQDLVAISCQCGRKVERVVCGDGDQKLIGAKLPQVKKSLDCDEECMREERNRRFAEALDINPETHNKKEVEYTRAMFEFCSRNFDFVKKVESSFREFLRSEKKVHNFPPMKGDQRAFIHELGAFYEFKTESVDQEPRRSVILRKTLNSKEPHHLFSEAYKRGDWMNQVNQETNTNMVSIKKKPTRKLHASVNAILMNGVDPLVNIEELKEVIKKYINAGFDIAKITPTSIVILPDSMSDLDKYDNLLEESMNTLKNELASVFTSISFCWVNKDHEVSVDNVIDFKKKTEQNLQKSQEPNQPLPINNPFDLLGEADIIEESKKSDDPWEEPSKFEVNDKQIVLVDSDNESSGSWEHVDQIQAESTPEFVPPSPYIIDEIDVPSDWTSLLPDEDD